MRADSILRIELGWPAKELWPNTSVHHMVLGRFKKAARKEGFWATRIALRPTWAPAGEKVKIHLIAHPKPVGPYPDAQNLISALKGAFDGIADAIGINDKHFDAPTLEFADRSQRGKLIVVLS